MTILFGFAVSRFHRSQISEKILLPAVLLVLVGENALSNYALEPKDGAPTVTAKLQEIRKPHEAVLFIPMTDEVKPNRTVKSWRNFALKNVNYMNWAIDRDLLVVNGYSGQRTRIMKELPGETAQFPDVPSLHAIAKISNLRYVIFESRYIPNFSAEKFQAQFEYFSDSLELIEQDGEGYYLFRVTGETKLSEREYIRVPSHTAAEQLTFEVKAPYDADGGKAHCKSS